jgi:hypothetical protein
MHIYLLKKSISNDDQVDFILELQLWSNIQELINAFHHG